MIKIIYRISDGSYKKDKPAYITKEKCLSNALNVFSNCEWTIIADNVSEATLDMIRRITKNEKHIISTSLGNAGSFNYCLDLISGYNNNDIVYFLEDDYLHIPNSKDIILEGIKLGADFVSLYDHPDKYIDGINPYIEDGGEYTKVVLTESCHWKLTNSTTMTFASRVSNVNYYKDIFKKYTSEKHPNDFKMWVELRNNGASLITPIPSFSTHGETRWLAPLVDWSKI